MHGHHIQILFLIIFIPRQVPDLIQLKRLHIQTARNVETVYRWQSDLIEDDIVHPIIHIIVYIDT